MTKYFITATYQNWLPPTGGSGRWHNNTGVQTCNGFITMHPVDWLAKRQEKQRKAWDEEKAYTAFEEVLFYDLLPDSINTDSLQNLT